MDKMDKDDVAVEERTTPYKGYFRIDVYRLRHKLFEGGWSGTMTREVFERRHAVTCVLYDADMDRLVLIEQFRIGAYAALASKWFDDDFSPWLIENIAGIIEKGESPEEVARREALEEAGCEIHEMVPVCHYLASPGGSSESIFVFCGQVNSRDAGGIYGLADEHENIRVHVLHADEVFQWMDAGRICNAMTLVGLQWFRAHHQELRERWRKAEG